MCENKKQCIMGFRYCDGKMDCNDGTDENPNCGMSYLFYSDYSVRTAKHHLFLCRVQSQVAVSMHLQQDMHPD